MPRVYNKNLPLQQFLCKSQRGAESEGRVVHERAGAGVAKLVAAVVGGDHDADELAAAGVFKELLQVADDRAIGLPSLELEDLCLWSLALRGQLWLLSLGC